MVCIVSARTALLPLVLLSVARQFAEGHSWIDCIDTNHTKIYDLSASYIFGGAEGNGFCEAYAAGYKGRGLNTIGTEYTYKILKNEVEAGAPVCEDVGPEPYKDWCKRLVVPPEKDIHFAYLPNGHIVKDQKAVGTKYGIYWPKTAGTSLTSTHDMIPENLVTGKLMDFDDGNCGETVDINGNPSDRAGDGKPCIGTFAIPKGTPPGIYKMVWYWEFWLDNPDAYKDPKLARGYFGAAYTSCFEVEVTAGGGGNGTTTSDAAGKPGPPDAPMAPDPLKDDEADPPSPPPPGPLQDDEPDLPSPPPPPPSPPPPPPSPPPPSPPPPPPTAAPVLTPPIDAASAPMGSDSKDDSTDTPPLPEAKSPETTTPVPEPTDTPEEDMPDSTTPESAPKDMPEEEKPDSTTPDPEAEAPAPAADNSVEPPAAPPAEPKPSPEVPPPIPTGRGCRARVRSSVVIDW